MGKGGIYLFEDIDSNGKKHKSGVRYPDFYKNDFVLDARYKRLESYDKVSQVNRDDLHQAITYMENLNATRGGFIAPFENHQITIPTSRLKQKDATLSIFGIEICKTAKSYSDFCDRMKEIEEEFVKSLNL